MLLTFDYVSRHVSITRLGIWNACKPTNNKKHVVTIVWLMKSQLNLISLIN